MIFNFVKFWKEDMAEQLCHIWAIACFSAEEKLMSQENDGNFHYPKAACCLNAQDSPQCQMKMSTPRANNAVQMSCPCASTDVGLKNRQWKLHRCSYTQGDVPWAGTAQREGHAPQEDQAKINSCDMAKLWAQATGELVWRVARSRDR